MRSLAAAVMLIGLVIAGHAESQTLRSDLPLWHDDQGAEDIYPQNFFNEDTFGCEHAIWPGLYTFTPTDGERYPQARIDLWSADNCVISSQDMLRTMAREALGRATLGQLAYIEDDRDSGAAPEADAPR